MEKLSPCALQTFNLTRTDEAMGRFLCGRQILVIFSVYLSSQVSGEKTECEGEGVRATFQLTLGWVDSSDASQTWSSSIAPIHT